MRQGEGGKGGRFARAAMAGPAVLGGPLPGHPLVGLALVVLGWTGDWELIDGIPLAMALSPSLAHQVAHRHLSGRLFTIVAGCSQCEALFEIDVEFAEDTVTRPDVIVVCFAPASDRIAPPKAGMLAQGAPPGRPCQAQFILRKPCCAPLSTHL